MRAGRTEVGQTSAANGPGLKSGAHVQELRRIDVPSLHQGGKAFHQRRAGRIRRESASEGVDGLSGRSLPGPLRSQVEPSRRRIGVQGQSPQPERLRIPPVRLLGHAGRGQRQDHGDRGRQGRQSRSAQSRPKGGSKEQRPDQAGEVRVSVRDQLRAGLHDPAQRQENNRVRRPRRRKPGPLPPPAPRRGDERRDDRRAEEEAGFQRVERRPQFIERGKPRRPEGLANIEYERIGHLSQPNGEAMVGPGPGGPRSRLLPDRQDAQRTPEDQHRDLLGDGIDQTAPQRPDVHNEQDEGQGDRNALGQTGRGEERVDLDQGT